MCSLANVKPCMLVHILYVFVSLSVKGMLGAGLGDVWELNSQNHRMTESQNGRGWKGPLGVI